jgi:hypothetical protein|tara:strand:- start:3828 stop:4007 length:180 start_codon:yes stop_codon:yes gene_type:complete
MPQYKDWLVEHPKKGKIKIGKLSHNELCRYAFNLLLECSRLRYELEKSKPKEDKNESEV